MRRGGASSSWQRLVVVAALFAVGMTGPLLMACLFGEMLDMSWVEQTVVMTPEEAAAVLEGDPGITPR